MATEKRNQLKEIMSLAWSFVRKNGYSMSEALKCAWTNIKIGFTINHYDLTISFLRKISFILRNYIVLCL